MTDVTTGKPLQVKYDEVAGPYFWVPYVLAGKIKELCDSHRVRCYISENVMSYNGGPEIVFIHFGKDGKREIVQALLDSVP
jgi:hypothetical protein